MSVAKPWVELNRLKEKFNLGCERLQLHCKMHRKNRYQYKRQRIVEGNEMK